MTSIDVLSPLYLHSSYGTNSIVVEKLEECKNYIAWKRSLEIALASKRKLGFVASSVAKDAQDKVKQEAWDTCNNMVISWIMGNVAKPIKKKSVMLLSIAQQIWRQLEQRFEVTNGCRTYQLNKSLYETKQEGKGVNEYYTDIKVFWEQLEMLNTLPTITNITVEVRAFINALNQQKDEHKLFQFLNGLDEINNVQRTERSHKLMMSPLPTVEQACSTILQEETQRAILRPLKEESEGLVIYSKTDSVVCGACGKKGHVKKCWTVISYPSWFVEKQTNAKGKEKRERSRVFQ